jgi:hypothetical protein
MEDNIFEDSRFLSRSGSTLLEKVLYLRKPLIRYWFPVSSREPLIEYYLKHFKDTPNHVETRRTVPS